MLRKRRHLAQSTNFHSEGFSRVPKSDQVQQKDDRQKNKNSDHDSSRFSDSFFCHRFFCSMCSCLNHCPVPLPRLRSISERSRAGMGPAAKPCFTSTTPHIRNQICGYQSCNKETTIVPWHGFIDRLRATGFASAPPICSIHWQSQWHTTIRD